MIPSKAMVDIWSSDIRDIAATNLPWHQFSGARILISGAGGFLGGYFARCLLSLHRLGKIEKPVQVVAMVRDVTTARNRLADIIDNPYLEVIEWDLRLISVPIIGCCQYVIHAASKASPRLYGRDPVGTLLPNTLGTAVLLEALQKQSSDPKGFLFLSSSEIYGSVMEESGLSETDYGTVHPTSLRACYGESKRLGETLCVAWTQQYKTPTFIVRPFHTYGPGLQENDGRVFADFIFNVVRNENILMKSDGLARRAYCYASDAIAGFFTVLLSGEPAMPYNVANPDGEMSVFELAELIVSLCPEKRLVVERQLAFEDNGYLAGNFSRLVPNVSRLKALGWSPKVAPFQGFQRMLRAYQQ